MQEDPTALFWSKVQRIFGEIPKLIRLILEYNGFDTLLALKGISWEDKKDFFEALEDSVLAILDSDEEDLKQSLIDECAANHQKPHNFKLKLGHKNLIINLCHELQKTNIDDFNGAVAQFSVRPKVLVVRKPEEHGYSRENERKRAAAAASLPAEVPEKIVKQENIQAETSIQYLYESDEEDNNSQFVEQEYLEELEQYDGDTELVEYQEIQREEVETDENCLYASEQIIKNEADLYEQTEYEISHTDYDSSSSVNRSGPKSKKPKHMYTAEFLQTQMTQGRIGTPGRRRPKIQKHYPDTEDGMLERWADLVRQSCEVIVPNDLLAQHDLTEISLVKIHDNVWEVKCPMCTKKLRLQLTHEGKYTNYKRSNFERHLRIVHYRQISKFNSEEEATMNSYDEANC